MRGIWNSDIAQILVEHARVWRILIGRRVADARSSRTLLTAVGTSRTEKKERKEKREKANDKKDTF